MNTNISIPQETVLLTRILNNQRRIMILDYLERAALATNGVIARVLKLRTSQVSKDISLFLKAQLVEKEKIGKTVIYRVTERWASVKVLLKK